MMVYLPCPCVSFLCGGCSSPALPLWRAEMGPWLWPSPPLVLSVAVITSGCPAGPQSTRSSLSAGRRVTLSKFTWPLLGFSFLICKMRLVILIIALGLPWRLSW